jgi:hypothetical protein
MLLGAVIPAIRLGSGTSPTALAAVIPPITLGRIQSTPAITTAESKTAAICPRVNPAGEEGRGESRTVCDASRPNVIILSVYAERCRGRIGRPVGNDVDRRIVLRVGHGSCA